MAVTIGPTAAPYLDFSGVDFFLRTPAVLLEAQPLSGRIPGSKLNPGERVFDRERLLALDVNGSPIELFVEDDKFVARDLVNSPQLPQHSRHIELLADPIDQIDEAAPALSDKGATNPIESQVGYLLDILEEEMSEVDKAITLLTEIQGLLDYSLDLMDEEAHLISDATEMAIDQVQDMRLAWLETPASSTYANILMSAILLMALEYAAVAAVTVIIARSFRCWKDLPQRLASRRARAADKKQLRRGRSDKQHKLPRARAQADLEYRKAAASVVEHRIRARHSSASDLFLSKSADAAATLRAQKAQNVAKLREEFKELETALPALEKKIKNFDPEAELGSRLDEMVLAPAIEQRFATIGKVSVASTKGIAKGLSSNGGRAAGSQKRSPGSGESPSTLVRLQASRMTQLSSLEINGIRRNLDRIVLLALIEPETIPDALAHCRSLLDTIVWPPDTAANYEHGVRQLALDIELTLWAIILPDLKISGTTVSDFLSSESEPSDQVQFENFRTTVKGLKNHMLGYFMIRFSEKLGLEKVKSYEEIDPEKNDVRQQEFVGKFTQELRKRRKIFEKKGDEILKSGKSDEKSVIDADEGLSIKDSVLFDKDGQSLVDDSSDNGNGMSTEPSAP